MSYVIHQFKPGDTFTFHESIFNSCGFEFLHLYQKIPGMENCIYLGKSPDGHDADRLYFRGRMTYAWQASKYGFEMFISE